MDLWGEYKKRAFGDFNNAPLLLSTGDRHHTSVNMLGNRAVELQPGRIASQTYGEWKRYIYASNITFDAVASIYDVNSRSMFAVRFLRAPKAEDWKKIKARVDQWTDPNIELRIFGMQNGTTDMMMIPELLHNNIHGKYMEIDLFGNEVRNIALDLKTGVSYNMLLLNRLYRPGELITPFKKEQFDLTRADLQI
ncbi:MAG: hypothetical protein KGH67_00600 [Candidatus Micrarchaeota archaeon]|nr:hypothetical protein [Candidatus Micrarchaeota archaeon]MDE1859010.1 hypothetical protein [Candidatus Micrarchaeota archaeon]